MPEIFDSMKATKKAKLHTPQAPIGRNPEGGLTSTAEVQDVTVVEAAEDAKVSRMTTEERKSKHVDDYSSVMRNESPSRNPFVAFSAKPFNVAFDAQHSDEQVLLLLRQSIITQIKFVLIAIGLLFVPFLFNAVGMLDFLPLRFQFVANVGWYLLVFSYVLETFLSWFYNVYIITDERIIDVDFNSLLFKNVAYAKIDNIEDITATTAGALGSIFDYGTVRIQTAGAISEFEFVSVPQPSKVVSFLNELLIEEEQEFHNKRAN